MADSTPNRHDVSLEDAQRLDRLSEEIRSRLTEMAYIVSRISGADYAGGAVQKFVSRDAEKKIVEPGSGGGHFDYIEIIEIVPGFECCVGSIGGHTILECPCGSG